MPSTTECGKIIDGIVNTDLRPPGFPSTYQIYEAAREQTDQPMTLAAAESLIDAVDPGDTVIVTEGAGEAPWHPVGEPDGPLGAASIARTLAMALGAKPVLTTEERNMDVLTAVTRVGGLPTVPWDQLQDRNNAATVVPYTTDFDEEDAEAERFLDEYDPAAIIGVEKIGPNREGHYHSLFGKTWDAAHAKIAPLFDRAEEEGVLTIGIGDGGNEIGMGNIEEACREIQPYGETCQCPCEGGSVTRVGADHLVVAGSSNWGAYGIGANIAIQAERPDALHTPDDETRMLEFAMRENATDGFTTRPVMQNDNASEAALRSVVTLLNNIVENQFQEIDSSIREFETVTGD